MAKRKSKEEWLEHLNNIHNFKYNYSKVNFLLGVMVKQIVICPDHGDWQVTIDNHSTKKSGCPKCSGKKWNKEDFVKKAKNVHNDLFDYSKVKFKNQSSKVEIICKKHGSFFQTPHHHIQQKQGCYKCGREISSVKHTKTIKELEVNARKIHFNDYKYHWDSYMGYLKPMDIECIKHGVFKQSIANHNQGQGCPICKTSKGELKIRQCLIDNNIKFERQYKFENCKNIYPLPFDFYLPDLNVCIEFDGEQHFKATKRFGGQKYFEKVKINDNIKNKFCKSNNIKLIRISYKELNKIKNILCNLI